MNRRAWGLWGAAAVVLAGATVAAQTRKVRKSAPAAEQSEPSEQSADAKRRAAEAPGTDASIVARLHQMNRAQIDAARTAQRQAQHEPVRSFAMTLVNDHQAADDRLMEWVAQNEQASDVLKRKAAEGGQAETAMLEKLQNTPGERFDRTFLTATIRLQDKTIELAAPARDQVANFDLRAMLQDLLPTLNQHRATARKLLDEVEAAPPVADTRRAPGAAAPPAAPPAAPTARSSAEPSPPSGGAAEEGNRAGAAAPPADDNPPAAPKLPPPAEIRARIVEDPTISDDDVEVTIQSSAVILTGRVDSLAEKQLAGALAQRVVGPTVFVDNRLMTGRPLTSPSTP
jgi:putative membrane protein